MSNCLDPDHDRLYIGPDLGPNFWQSLSANNKSHKELAPMLSGHMGESFQDYSWIQDFEADFPQKVSLKKLN